MPKLSVWMVRAALLHMGGGFLFGALLLHHKGIPIYVWTWRLLGPHIELMVLGWTMQFAMGMAFSALPRFSNTSTKRYGATHWGWLAFVLLNSGVCLGAWGSWAGDDALALVGRLLVLAAIVAFVRMIWPRVKPLGGYAASQR